MNYLRQMNSIPDFRWHIFHPEWLQQMREGVKDYIHCLEHWFKVRQLTSHRFEVKKLKFRCQHIVLYLWAGQLSSHDHQLPIHMYLLQPVLLKCILGIHTYWWLWYRTYESPMSIWTSSWRANEAPVASPVISMPTGGQMDQTPLDTLESRQL